MSVCRVCSLELTKSNRYPSDILYKKNICKTCRNSENKNRAHLNIDEYNQNQRERRHVRRYEYNEWSRNYMQEYRKIHPEYRSLRRGRTSQFRLLAIQSLGQTKCVNCGCLVSSLLEINHKKGNGAKEIRDRFSGHRDFYRALYLGKIDRGDYDVRCRVCNVLHYVTDILGIKGHSVVWTK